MYFLLLSTLACAIHYFQDYLDIARGSRIDQVRSKPYIDIFIRLITSTGVRYLGLGIEIIETIIHIRTNPSYAVAY